MSQVVEASGLGHQKSRVSLADDLSKRQAKRRREQLTYQMLAMGTTLGIGGAAVVATYLKFSASMEATEGPFPLVQMLLTLMLVFGGMLAMELWARWAHRVLWHGPAGWLLHESHHSPRKGLFEANDLYAIINAAPAIALCCYGFYTTSVFSSLCYGAGLGISLYGMMYMFVHDGVVHKRFPVGPIADLPAMKRVVAAHRLHHTGKYGGLPWGMFLGPAELEAVGAGPELDKLVAELGSAHKQH